MKAIISSYWKVLRIIFVVFSLYLMKDAFFRWDGVSYYASFSDFLSGVALILILWSIIAIITAVLIWLALSSIKLLSKHFDKSIKAEHLYIFIYLLILFGTATLYGKRLLFEAGLTLQQKLAVSICIILLAIFVTWILRKKNERINQWIDIQERITPFVWLFSIFVIISIIIVMHSVWTKQTTNKWDLLQKARSSTAKESLDNNLYQNTHKSATVNKSRPNIILVTYDALTARNMSSYGCVFCIALLLQFDFL